MSARISISEEEAARDALVDGLVASGKIERAAIAAAFRSVPRHLFVPEVSLAEAYQDEVIFTKARDGVSLSASSSPSIMAEMLHLLDPQPGERVLEIGAGTGYNAAILEALVGPTGRVVSLDIDQDLVDRAHANLAAAGLGSRVELVCADGGFGYPAEAPHDRIVVTVGAWDVAPAWLDQLVEGGRLVVPLEFRDVHKLVTFVRRGDVLRSLDVRDCRFVQLRGAFAGPERQLPLTSSGLYLSTQRERVEAQALAALLTTAGEPRRRPLPIEVTPEELHRAVRLWLALRTEDFCLVSLEGEALRSSRIRAWNVTAQREARAPDASARFASVPGLLDGEGICLLERSDEEGKVGLACYGEGEGLALRADAYLREWDRAGRPFAAGLTIEAAPLDRDPRGAEESVGSWTVDKRWFRYRLQPVRPAASASSAQRYWYVSFTPPDLSHPVERLIESARTWTPCPGRVLEAFDFASLAARLSPAPDPPGLPEPGARPRALAEAVLEVLNLEAYRRGPREHLDAERDRLLPRLEERIRLGQPVRVVIPSFPGRPYNPYTHQRVAPDLSEAYAIGLLARISKHVAKFYGPAVQFVICLDGQAYNPLYGYTNEADHQYPVDLQRFIDALGVQAYVSLIDLQDLVEARAAEFAALEGTVREELTREWENPEYRFRDELVNTMKMGTNTVAINAAAVYLIKYLDERQDAADLVARMRGAVLERARTTAFEYMTFLVTIRRMGLIERELPDAIRGTVHPKPGQYSPYLVGRATRIAPWHGVAVMRLDGGVDTVYESEVFEEPSRYRAVFLRGDYTPFYYEELRHPAESP